MISEWIKPTEFMKTTFIILLGLVSNLVFAGGLNIGVAAVENVSG